MIKAFYKRIHNANCVVKNYINLLCSSKKAFFVSLFTALSYSFSLFTRTVSVDDLAKDLYIGNGNSMISGMRWFFYIWNRLFSTIVYTPYIDEIFALLLLFVATILIGSIFYYLKKDNKIWSYIIFSIFFINYPLINEIWEYSGTCTAIYGGLALASYGVLYYLVNEDSISVVDIVFIGLLLTPSMASYESVIFVYIELVLIVLYLCVKSDKNYKWFKNGLLLALPLLVALIIRLCVGYVLIKMLGLHYSPSGNSHLYWSQGSFVEAIKLIFNKNYDAYFKAIHYLPIFEFIVAFVLYCLVSMKNIIKNYRILPLVIFVFMSIFSLSYLQANQLPYRTAQTVQLFVAFAYYLFINENNFNKSIGIIVISLFLFLGLRSSIYLHNLLALNNQRSENEAAVIRNIGQRLYTEFDKDKIVIFCGNYDMGDFINTQVEDLTETNVQSMINWSMIAFEKQDMMKEYFSYYGFDIKTSDIYFDINTNYKYQEIARENNMRPLDILDMGDYILVYFG